MAAYDSPLIHVIHGNGDDQGARLRAAASAGGLILLSGTIRHVATSSPVSFAAGTTVLGVGNVVVEVESNDDAAYREVFALTAADVTLTGVTIRRVEDFPSVMFALGSGVSNVRMIDCTFDGGADLHDDNYSHGFKVPNSGTVFGIHSTGCVWENFRSPWLQSTASTATVEHVRFTDCILRDHTGELLSFNAPNGACRDVVVQGCRLTSSGGHLGLALAKVTGATIANNYFAVADEAIHVEDYTTDVSITGNTFDRCALVGAAEAVIEVIDSHRITIIGNTFINPEGIAHASHGIVNIHGETSGTTTSGGARNGATRDIIVTGNTFVIDSGNPATLLFETTGVTTTGNAIETTD